MSSSSIRVVPRLSQERGHADHGWLKTFHTWSFAGYQDYKFMDFSNLRVLNEDRVDPNQGFGSHSHREFEIFSYIISGQLQHRDSMGNVEVMKRGDVQMTSAGTGIAHSEMTHGAREVHFLQIWCKPNQRALPPSYFTRHFTDAEKRDTLLKIVGMAGSPGVTAQREASGPTPIHSNVSVFASILSKGKDVVHKVDKSRRAYVHVIQSSGYNTGPSTGSALSVSGTVLREGDGAFIYADNVGDEIPISNVGTKDVEFLVFDVE